MKALFISEICEADFGLPAILRIQNLVAPPARFAVSRYNMLRWLDVQIGHGKRTRNEGVQGCLGRMQRRDIELMVFVRFE
jgi:hypothetical protein